MTDHDKILAIEDIKYLKGKYFYHLDRKDWDGWRKDVFAEDATMDVPETNAPPLVGIDTIIGFVSKILDGVVTVHHGHMPIIDFVSDSEAKGIWAMEDVLFWPPGRIPGLEGRVHGYGHYRETYRRHGEGWRIQSLLLTRLHLGPMP